MRLLLSRSIFKVVIAGLGALGLTCTGTATVTASIAEKANSTSWSYSFPSRRATVIMPELTCPPGSFILDEQFTTSGGMGFIHLPRGLAQAENASGILVDDVIWPQKTYFGASGRNGQDYAVGISAGASWNLRNVNGSKGSVGVELKCTKDLSKIIRIEKRPSMNGLGFNDKCAMSKDRDAWVFECTIAARNQDLGLDLPDGDFNVVAENIIDRGTGQEVLYAWQREGNWREGAVPDDKGTIALLHHQPVLIRPRADKKVWHVDFFAQGYMKFKLTAWRK